ncbi:hypothetical protein LOD99_15529 [Oopsacas minuta]|uniref:Uncharacterized protein n=1 Tax=Oopsacas minuta TaxID=111878 RepID=A0AAV7KBK2_9METZ|nr:hypothetical protein LOD99_15529 [Oopsacas minuta]
MGKLSILIFNKNKPNTRAPLYLKWKLNRNHFQDYIKQSMEGNSRKLNSDSGTDIFQLAVHISTGLDSDSIYVNSLDPSNISSSQLDTDFSVDNLERKCQIANS